jgi:thiol-disulfide isomerase/thioredoxin
VLLWSSGKARADEVVTADLETKPTGGIHAMMPLKVKLSPTKPAGVTREPAYSGQPSYGVLTLGDAKNNQIVVALVPARGENSPHLFVDSNGDGDLTNDPPVMLASASASPTTDGPHASGDTQTQPGAAGELRAVVPVTVRYNLTGRAGQVESTLEFTLLGSDLYVNREYSREGKITLNGRSYRVALVDQGVDGRFDAFKHEEDDPPRVTLLIDRSNTGRFNLRRDAFDASKPFRLGAAVYEVTSINVRGTHLTLQKSNKHVRGTVTATDLKVGNDAIDFDAERIDSKTVHFPDDYSGKIVLLDFWATWDPNSRSEVPYLVSAYQTYHDRGFDILGVSLDQANQLERVIGFARQFGMVWPEVYDGQYVNAEVARLYDIRALPSLFLVDGDTGQVLAMGKALVGQGLVGAIEQALQNRKTR